MKYNSIGEQLIAKAKELDPSYKPDKFNDMSEAIDVILNNSGSGGIPTANVNLETYQLDTSSLTDKDQYVIASMDDGEGNIMYAPLQTYFFNDGYFNKEVNGGFLDYDNNYTLRDEVTNIDFTNTLDSTNTWTKLGDIKYIAIEEQSILTGESSHKYLEINSIPTLPSDASTKTYTLQTVNGVLTWTDAIGDINTILDNINGEVI